MQPPYSFSLKERMNIIDVVPLSKDTLTRGWYWFNTRVIEDPTTWWAVLTNQPNTTEYTELETLHINTLSNKLFNYSSPTYEDYKDVFVDYEFTNGRFYMKTKLKETARVGDFVSYIGGLFTSTLLIFRFVTKSF